MPAKCRRPTTSAVNPTCDMLGHTMSTKSYRVTHMASPPIEEKLAVDAHRMADAVEQTAADILPPLKEAEIQEREKRIRRASATIRDILPGLTAWLEHRSPHELKGLLANLSAIGEAVEEWRIVATTSGYFASLGERAGIDRAELWDGLEQPQINHLAVKSLAEKVATQARCWAATMQPRSQEPSDSQSAVKPPSASKSKPKRRGRPPRDADRKRKDRQLYDAWATGQHRTYADLAAVMGISEEDVKRALNTERKRRKH